MLLVKGVWPVLPNLMLGRVELRSDKNTRMEILYRILKKLSNTVYLVDAVIRSTVILLLYE